MSRKKTGLPDVNARDELGRSPLHLAAWREDPEAVKILLDAGADPVSRNRRGQSAFDFAADFWDGDGMKNTEAYRRLEASQQRETPA